MSLEDYVAKSDKFELARFSSSLGFPCNTCEHSKKTDKDHPCNACGHNLNSGGCMSVVKTFTAVISIGVVGVAVLNVEESANDDAPNAVLNDIKTVGTEFWFETVIENKPENPGIYTCKGTVNITHDALLYDAEIQVV